MIVLNVTAAASEITRPVVSSGPSWLDAGISGIADVDAIRKADSLPQTAIELQAIARALNASNDDVYLRERATETRVKSLDLSPYRFIAFATHGVIAGEMPGLAEPGLILTPPSTGNATDDGIFLE